MAENNCAHCGWRAKYDSNSKSFLGRLWRWHINFCPGWKRYFASLPPEEKAKLAEQYHLKGFKP